ncbi:hypothetical protein [Reinekea sp. G2M2-21]|uniref:hypothetical protein n=1 Tax=Reinekea sp. G2M2-21 TaxID=2788942 RepID=UPI0018AC8496|nr:hypothetical protein [Reinekea sp. G2M2-21]
MLSKNFLSENYDSQEYSSEYEAGYYHDQSYLQLVLPLSEIYVDSEHKHLVIGSAGADGIEFCLRQKSTGVWAYYPNEGVFEKVAENINELVKGWASGSIKV